MCSDWRVGGAEAIGRCVDPSLEMPEIEPWLFVLTSDSVSVSLIGEDVGKDGGRLRIPNALETKRLLQDPWSDELLPECSAIATKSSSVLSSLALLRTRNGKADRRS
jgi:hypothetical protein